MANIVKTEYMNQPILGFSEYLVKYTTDLTAISPQPGDRAIVVESGLYICITQGSWEKIGG